MSSNDRTSSNLDFLTAYHTAKLAEFDFVSQAGTSIDTKAGVLLAANFAVLAIMLPSNISLDLLSKLNLCFLLVNIEIGIWSLCVRNHDGPLANVPFKSDIRKGYEIKTMRQLIEDTDSYITDNLAKLSDKRLLFWVQVAIMCIVLVIMILKAILLN